MCESVPACGSDFAQGPLRHDVMVPQQHTVECPGRSDQLLACGCAHERIDLRECRGRVLPARPREIVAGAGEQHPRLLQNRDQPLPVVLTGPAESAGYFEQLSRFISGTLGESALKRLQIIVNFNTDISQFWEWSGTGLRSISDTNESYKLGVNYLIYGLTH